MLKKVNVNTLVNEIVLVAGVSKDNAIKIFNLVSGAWTQDRVGLFTALEKGIPLSSSRTTRTRKKATVRKPTVRKTTKKVKKTPTKKAGTTPVATVKTAKTVKKGKKKLKKNKVLPTVSAKTSTKSRTKTA